MKNRNHQNLLVLLAGLAFCAVAQGQVTVPAPILKLDFNNNLNDTSGATPAHNGTFAGAGSFSADVPVPANTGNESIVLDGNNTAGGFVVVGHPGDFNLDTGSSFTFSAWIKKNYANDNQHVLFAKAPPDSELVPSDASTKTPALYINASGNLVWDVYYSGAAQSSGVVKQGVWTHMAVACDGSTLFFYLNGQPAGQGGLPGTSETGGSWATPWEVTIGATANPWFPGWRDTGLTNGIFKGNIDYVRFWNQQLTDAQVQQAFLSTGELITINQSPADATAAIGTTASFTVSATLSGAPAGTALSYQWQTNGVGIAGATKASYTTPALTSNDSGVVYNCQVSAPGALTQTSATATLTVVQLVPPPPPLAWLGLNNNLNDQSGQALLHNGTLVNVSGQAKFTSDVANTNCGTASLSLPGDGS